MEEDNFILESDKIHLLNEAKKEIRGKILNYLANEENHEKLSGVFRKNKK